MSPDSKIIGKCHHAVLYGAWGPYGVVDHMGYMVYVGKSVTPHNKPHSRDLLGRIQEGGCLPVG